MYNEKILTINKIISDKLLEEIFLKMYEEKRTCEKLYDYEKKKNELADYNNQHWTLNMFQSSLDFTVDFYDNSNITFDNYTNFISVFNNRKHEIKSIMCFYSLNYFDENMNPHKNTINLFIYEDSMDINVSIDSNDNYTNEIFNYIKSQIENAPDKYDYIVKNKNSIINKYVFSQGSILGITISILLLFIPKFSILVINYFWIYPILTIVLSFIIGTIFFSGKLYSLYRCIDMEKIYDRYDLDKGKSIYKDDKNKYINSAEVIIGKNIDNIKIRNEIKRINEKYKNYIFYECVVILIITLIIFIL